MNKRLTHLLLFCLSAFGMAAQDSYPTPPDGLNRLFYIQRTGNTNTIIYDANVSGDKTFKASDPVNIYWLRYADGGGTAGLNYMQRTFAYGVKSRKVDGTNEYEIHLVSYSKKKLRLAFDAHGKPYVTLDVNGRRMKLDRIFVKIDKSTTFTLAPKVEYVELWGKDPNTGAAVYEKFIP
ncbi:MAG: DUF4833 domain-containing protein [Haliscomenobacteraceae bacterium CHB4]|nr:hypothetical protein [Saprospiraceae bacterium]MCE7924432.1 DUF4833 domain-containing protein [Haliscomenobacteraceae bacterium CHB4]